MKKTSTTGAGGHWAVPEEKLSEALHALAAESRDGRRRLAGRAMLVNAAADLRIARDRRRRRRIRILGPVVAVVAGLGGSVVASASALPDSPLYGIKRATETLQLDLTFDPHARGLLEVQFANERAQEADAMAGRGRADLAVAAANDAQASLQSAEADLGPGDGVAWARQSVSAKLDEVAAMLSAKGAGKAAAAVSGAADKAHGLGVTPGPGNAGHGQGNVAPTPGASHGPDGGHPTPPGGPPAGRP